VENIGIAFFEHRQKQFAIATPSGKFFCGKEDQTFTSNVEEAYFFATEEDAMEGLQALKELLSKDETETEKKMTVTATKKAQPKEDVELEKPVANHSVALKKLVLQILGKPKDFLKIDAIHLYDNRYRINVWTRGESGAKISDNFFVKSNDGTILSCDPVLNKKYD